jgi:histidyl-tRNA synthetase
MTHRQEPIQSQKGMEDILPAVIGKWQVLEKEFRRILESWNFSEIRTPIVESIELFRRSIGEETDIISKEMFEFKDRGERHLALRPEMTASVVRSVIEHRLLEGSRNLGLYYWGPMYRAERPQKGRKREFYQAGCELFGKSHPFSDVVLLVILTEFLKTIGLGRYELKLNHLGTAEERKHYLKELKTYLEAHESKLSEDSKRRLQTNLLRIFDSKVPEDIEIMKHAPKILDFLGEKTKKEFETIQEKLRTFAISFIVEPKIVRGLDYYTGFVFEISHPSLGAQDAIGAGGRYDHLVKSLGGQETGASGFALGIERILMALEGEKTKTDIERSLIYFGALSDVFFDKLHALRMQVASEGIVTEADYFETSIKKHLGLASKLGAKAAVILGESEIARDIVLLKNMMTGEQKEVPMNVLANTVKDLLYA